MTIMYPCAINQTETIAIARQIEHKWYTNTTYIQTTRGKLEMSES